MRLFFFDVQGSPFLDSNHLTKGLALKKAALNGFLGLPAQVDAQQHLYLEHIFPQEEQSDGFPQIPFVYTEENNGD